MFYILISSTQCANSMTSTEDWQRRILEYGLIAWTTRAHLLTLVQKRLTKLLQHLAMVLAAPNLRSNS